MALYSKWEPTPAVAEFENGDWYFVVPPPGCSPDVTGRCAVNGPTHWLRPSRCED